MIILFAIFEYSTDDMTLTHVEIWLQVENPQMLIL
jgi:hypothetical protein